jgi:Arc/MetJ-type ribon-helix-helix transcriptional regulator
MKLLDLLNEVEKTEKPVKEVAPVQEAESTVVDEIGKFFVVKKPGKGMTKEDMVCEVTVFDEIKMDETKGVYKNRSEANRHATEALKEYEMQLKEMEDAMEAFRSAKKDIEEKKSLAKEKIQKLKQ